MRTDLKKSIRLQFEYPPREDCNPIYCHYRSSNRLLIQTSIRKRCTGLKQTSFCNLVAEGQTIYNNSRGYAHHRPRELCRSCVTKLCGGHRARCNNLSFRLLPIDFHIGPRACQDLYTSRVKTIGRHKFRTVKRRNCLKHPFSILSFLLPLYRSFQKSKFSFNSNERSSLLLSRDTCKFNY